MDSVPYAFCDAVSSTLRDISAFKEFCSTYERRVWAAAVEGRDAIRLRVFIGGAVRQNAMRWSCQIISDDRRSKQFTLQELQQMIARTVCITRLELRSVIKTRNTCTFEEMIEVAKIIVPFVNLAELHVANGGVEIAKRNRLEILSLFSGCSFWKIFIENWRPYPENVLGTTVVEFLSVQMRSELLKSLHVEDDERSDEFQAAFEEFVLTKPFENIVARHTKLQLRKSCFEQLLEKPLEGKELLLIAPLSFTFDDFRSFKKESQLPTNKYNTIIWSREDGVRINLSSCYNWVEVTFERMDRETVLMILRS